ncbi:MAG: phosphate/phosphite/phosphonate ABC transporter substrate-binding protein [Nitrospiraceae bacterium]|nr:MAG: phosphate/phosphite/phosphonate ABC transporter substrate-binding protein [Nitrospiraceae bacterium]
MRRFLLTFLLLQVFSIAFLPAVCSSQDNKSVVDESVSPLVFIILPVENVSVMYEKFLPLKNYLEKELSRKVVLKVAQNYQEAIESIGTGKAHLAYLDPSAYCEAKQQHKIVPLVKTISAGSSTYRSVLVTRKDSAVSRIIDAKGKRVALGNIWSSSSSLIPSVMFKEVGINLKDFTIVDFLEHEDRIALSVLTGKHDIGGLSEKVAKKYINDGLRIINTSEAIPQYSVCAYPGLPKSLQDTIRQALISIEPGRNPELVSGMKDITGFSPAEDRDFDVVRVMIKNLTGKNYIEYSRNSIKVAILPLYSAITLFDRFDPLMRYLSSKTGYEFKLVIPRDFEDFFETIRQGKADFSYSNPYIYIQLADKGYLKAFANTVQQESASGDVFRGIIITHRDSSIKTLDDLKGKRVMVVSFKSAGGFLAQKLFLSENGIEVFKDLHLIDGKRQEEVILNVYRKNVDAGFVRESALNVLKEEIDLGKIHILAVTPYISNWPFAVTRNTDTKISAAVQEILMSLKDPDILSAAHITGFKPANDGDFDALRKWINSNEAK